MAEQDINGIYWVLRPKKTELNAVCSKSAKVGSSNRTPPLSAEEAPFQNIKFVLKQIKIWSWGPKRPEMKIGSAGDGH
jgi:hypothetical protein